MIDHIWTEKYRPQKLDDLCISGNIRETIKGFGENMPNLLFCGIQGTGKCLDGNEEIEVYIESEEEYKNILEFLGNGKTLD